MPDDKTGLVPAEQGTASWLGQSSSVMDLIGRFLNIKQHQKNQALQELESTVKLSQSGFPIDPKTFSKLVKKSGLPIATDEKTLSAFYGTQNQPMGKEGEQKQGEQGQQQGPQTMQAPQDANKYDHAVISAQNRVAQTGKPLDGGEMVAAQINGLASRALRLSNKNAATEEQKADNALMVQQLTGKALAGDNQARGRLMSVGQIPFDFHYESWSTMTEKQRGDMLDIAAGHESEAQRVERASRIAEGMMSSGQVRSPQAAFKIGEILAAGGEIPADLQKQIKPQTFTDLVGQAQLGAQLQEMGVPSDKLPGVLRAAQAGGLENALPGNIGMSLNERRLQLGLETKAIEEERYRRMTEIAAKADAAMKSKTMTDEQKRELENAKELVMLAKQGKIKVSADVVKQKEKEIADGLGLTYQETEHLFGLYTSGEYVPKGLSEEGASTIDELTGKPSQKKQVSPGVSQYLKGMKRD